MTQGKIPLPGEQQSAPPIQEAVIISEEPTAPAAPIQPAAPEQPVTPTIEPVIEPAANVGKTVIGNEVAIADKSSIQLREFNEYENVGQMLAAAQVIIDSGIAPNNFTEPEQIVGIMKYGNELGINMMTALNNIHMIQGRPTLGVHVITAQLKRHGIEYQLLEDYVGVEMGGQTDARTTFRFIDHVLLDRYKAELELYGKMPEAAQAMYLPILENLRQGIVKDVSYYWSQAVGASLHLKDNWQKDPRNMMRVRCLSAGARMVKPEALLGFYETTELAEALDSEEDIPKSYTVDTN